MLVAGVVAEATAVATVVVQAPMKVTVGVEGTSRTPDHPRNSALDLAGRTRASTGLDVAQVYTPCLWKQIQN